MDGGGGKESEFGAGVTGFLNKKTKKRGEKRGWGSEEKIQWG